MTSLVATSPDATIRSKNINIHTHIHNIVLYTHMHIHIHTQCSIYLKDKSAKVTISNKKGIDK